MWKKYFALQGRHSQDTNSFFNLNWLILINCCSFQFKLCFQLSTSSELILCPFDVNVPLCTQNSLNSGYAKEHGTWLITWNQCCFFGMLKMMFSKTTTCWKLGHLKLFFFFPPLFVMLRLLATIYFREN